MSFTIAKLPLKDVLALRAKDLKKVFGVYGHFYDLDINGECYPCRSLLDMVSNDVTHLDPTELLSLPVDAIIIMMNPGSSTPIDSHYRPVHISTVSEISLTRELVPTKPDTTQYQIMKVMAAMGWKHTRVLNLSDMIDPRSGSFIDKAAALSQTDGGHIHSLWCEERSVDRKSLMGTPNSIPVVIGWGRDAGLLPLIEQTWKGLTGWKVSGVSVSDDNRLYAHPSPMLQRLKDQWITDILQRLSGDRST